MIGSTYLDTNVFISAFEVDDEKADYAWAILEAVSDGSVNVVTSELTLAELLPKPIAAHDRELVDIYETLLNTGAGLMITPITRSILVASGRLRAHAPSLRLPDAIHVATALDQGCSSFVSSDLRIRSMETMSVLRLAPDTLAEIMRPA